MKGKIQVRKKATTLSIIFLLVSITNAQIPVGYYDSAAGLSGSGLKTALNTIIKGHTEKFYGDARYILDEADADPSISGNVRVIYSDHSVSGVWDSGVTWNREHVWSSSRGIGSVDNNTLGAGSDLHHLRACIPDINSARNNRWFDYGTFPYVYDGQETGSLTSSDGDWVWQPRPEDAGDVARMMFYMATRYEGEGLEPDLELLNTIPSDNWTNAPVFAKLSTLLAWHAMDPVDEFEQNRNNVIYGYQGNRNPFIDHPEYAQLMWNGETVVNFANATSSVFEDAGSIQVNVNIAYADTTNATNLDVSLKPTNAIAGSDYQVTMPQNLTFPAGSYTPLSFSIDILDDSDIDGADTLVFELSNISGGNNATLGNPTTFQLIIIDNEIAGGDGTGNLIISEVVDGPNTGGKPKILEITNTGVTDATLTGFVVSRYSGGSAVADETTFTFPEYALPAGKSVVLTNATEGDWATYIELAIPEHVIFGLDYGIGPIIGNGDDTYELRDNNSNVLDVYGYIGVDGTDSVWEYLDSYAYRNTDIVGGSATFNPAEWTIAPANFLDDKVGSLNAYLTPGTHTYVVSAVENEQHPEQFILKQNFPNPFNPSTTINYVLLQQSTVLLRIFDVLGNEVVSLQDDVKSAGSYSVQWNGMDQFDNPASAGVYFARLQTASASQTIKMVYLK